MGCVLLMSTGQLYDLVRGQREAEEAISHALRENALVMIDVHGNQALINPGQVVGVYPPGSPLLPLI